MRSKWLVLVMCFLMGGACLMSGCLNGKYDPDLSIGEQIKTRHYHHSADVFGRDELLDEILECIDTKDVDRMKELFSDYTLEENDELDEEIQALYDAFPEIDHYKDRSCAMSGSHNQGSTEYKYMYQIMITIYDEEGQMYHFITKWVEGCTESPDMQGLHSIQLIDRPSYDSGRFTVHSWDDRPGVYLYLEEE